jgi:DNA-directed RNA polymerase specialized sigma24 family protein
MAKRKTAVARLPSPPADATAGAALVRQFVVALFDRRDGNGVNWRVIAETLFKAAFDVLDRLPDDQRQALARRVYTGAYDRAAGNRAGETGGSESPAVEPPKAKAERAPRLYPK